MINTYLVNPQKETTTLKPPSPEELTLCTMKIGQFSSKIAAQLGFEGLDGAGEDNYDLFIYQFAFTDPNMHFDLLGKTPRGIIFGSAIRIGITIQQNKATANLNLEKIAAHGSLSVLKGAANFQFIGMDEDTASELAKLAGTSAPFSSETLKKIGAIVSQFRSDVMKNPSGCLQPDILERGEFATQHELKNLQSISSSYAIGSIWRGYNLDSTIDLADKRSTQRNSRFFYEKINSYIVQAVYYAATDGDPEHLTKTAKNDAATIYNNTRVK